MLELRHLYTLTALRAHGSLAAVADELHVTPSAISHQLKELESYYNIGLVNRRTRPLSFTPAGHEVLALADSILPQVMRTKTTLKRLAHGQTGKLTLASECHSCFDWLMPILNKYRQQWADVELDFMSGFEPQPHQLLLEEEIDLLITTSNLPINGLHYLPLFEYESRLVLCATNPLAKLDKITPNDLTNQTLIAYPVESKRLDVISNFMTPANKQFAKIRTTELTAMLIQLVASDRGVAALPDWVVADYEKKGWVVSRPLVSDNNQHTDGKNQDKHVKSIQQKTAKKMPKNISPQNDRGRRGVYCQLYAAVRSSSMSVAYVQGFMQLLNDLVKPPANYN